MPLLWKKMKSTKISQLVNDHLQNSQRRRGDSSLMVETGFPTSLVDLFIKNREKLKKSPKKKLGNINSPSTEFDDHPSPTPNPNPLSSSSPSPSPSPLQSPSVLDLTPESTAANLGEDEVSGLKKIVDSNGIFLLVMKMILVVALAMESKKFAFGFTLSAFLLFLMDYVLIRLRFLRKLVSTKAGFFKSEVRQVECFSLDDSSLKDCESSFQIRCDEIIEECSYDGDMGIEEMDVKMVVMEERESTELTESERKNSRKVKIKSKMKKLIPKKFRSLSKKESKNKEDNIAILEEQEANEYEDVREVESDSKMSSLSSERHDREELVTPNYCSSGELSKDNDEGEMSRGKEGQIWVYFVLCLIVLVGLIGGRIFALFLTIFSCSLLKSGETLRRNIKGIWSFAKISS